MTTPIRIVIDDLVLTGELDDSPTAQVVAEALPLEESLRTFGDAFYMETPVDADLDAAETEEVAVGDIAYWPAALAVIFFFGPTPESRPGSDEPAPPSEVSIIGKLNVSAELKRHATSTSFRIERA